MLLIFDLDGTLVDTWEEIEITFRNVFAREGIPLRIEDLRRAVGLPLDEVIRSLVGRRDEELVRKIRNEFLSLNPRRIKLFPGMEKVLDLPARRAVFTSKGDLGTYRDLDYLGIRHIFDIVVTSDTVANPKPHPEGIIKILENLRVDRDEAFMIGDTELDILAAKNAGIKSVAVSWGNRGYEFLKRYGPDFVVRSPDELYELLEDHAHL